MIEINNLQKKFFTQNALSDFNLQVKAGDRIALIGQNGAGKTTFLRCILGYYMFTGDLTLFGMNPRKKRVDNLERIGFVPQIPPPIQMTVGELIHFAAKISKNTTPQKIEEESADLGFVVGGHIHKPFFKLSGGMKQKLLIAIALAKNPSLLIMDEPTANLDPEGRKAFFERLAKSVDHLTMILSSHRVDEILTLINRIIEMDSGTITSDERIGVSPIANKYLSCSIKLLSRNDLATNTFQRWKFEESDAGMYFNGKIIGSDRLKLLNDLSHFAGYISKLEISE